MAEAGGASTQAGIFYQNSVAAVVLADLLEMARVPPRERVVEVRIEAPEDVDDILVRYADGHKEFFNVKTALAVGSAAWDTLWASLHAQFSRASFGADDQLTIVLSELTAQARTLRDLCERAATSLDDAEWRSRLATTHTTLLGRIESSLGSPEVVLELLRRTSVTIKSEDQIQDHFNLHRLGGNFSSPVTMLTTLRDIAGGGARKRAVHTAAPLRRRLALEFGIEVAEPSDWGLPAYRAAVASLARIQIPGTQVSGPADELFVWPRVGSYERSRLSGFEDELSAERRDNDAGIIDMRAFPSDHFDRCVVVAGPGYGKSALLVAIAGQLARGPMVPVVIPLASMAAGNMGVIQFLVEQIDREFAVRPDWQRLAEQGLLVLLFDGLDEVPAGARPRILRQINTFSARYSSVPWMLTVRDPSVLVGPFEAKVVELLPLNDEDIVRFVETMKRRLSTLNVYEFTSRLRQYPDLSQLARIPLFLSILLATVDDFRRDLPATRSDLIEGYLKTLFSPQAHKEVAVAHDRAVPLRRVAEALAFERLERQEVGASEREVREVIGRSAQGEEAASLFELLQSNGVMRPQSGIRLQFPFPIVQEYLAACHLVRNFPESLVERIDDAIQRPWAQVIQFAIEQHPDPTPVVRSMLERPDDAFCTGLRLVGRCVSNGARVDAATYKEVGDRLVQFWIGAASNARKRVGSIIADGFAEPMSTELRLAVHHRWLMHDGAGEIISNARDRTLTLSVWNGFLQSNLSRLTRYHPLDPAISEVGDDAFEAVLAALRECEPGTDKYEALASLPLHLEQGSVSRTFALHAALDTTFPRELRMIAFYIASFPLDERALPIVREVLADDDASGLWSALRVLSLHSERGAEFGAFLRNASVPMKRRREVAGYFSGVFPNEAERILFIREVLSAGDIARELIEIVQVFAARYGDHATFQALVERISSDPLEISVQTVSLFGHYPDRSLAERAAVFARNRVGSAEEAVRFGSAATTGMLYIFEMDWGFGGTLRYTMPHAGTPHWMELVQEWSERSDLSRVQRLQLLAAGSQLGSARARARLQSEVLSLTDIDTAVFEGESHGNIISNAIREAQRRGPLLPLSLAEIFVRSSQLNVPFAGVSAIEAHGTTDALNLLVRLHDQVAEWHLRDLLEGAIESLAARLGVTIRRDGRTLSTAEFAA